MNSKASVVANRAFQTASAWVRAEAEVAIVASTVDTITISATCGLVGMLIFTGDPTLALYVVVLLVGIISALAFFMVVLMAWKLGPIEIISLVIFVGYAVTFLLHIAHLYSESRGDDAQAPPEIPDRQSGEDEKKQRQHRVRQAVLDVGGATLSSAVSTLGSSMFLLFCTMLIFPKLGSVVIAVTILSSAFAIVVLPAVLILVGPAPGPWYARTYIGRSVMRGFSLMITKLVYLLR